MYKKIILILLVFSIFLCGCSNEGNTKEIYSCEEIFPENFFSDIIAITFIRFDETQIYCDDTDKVESILKILHDAEYYEKIDDEEDYLLGTYMLKFTSAEETYSIGIGNNVIAVESGQYRTDDKLEDEIISIIDPEYLNA